MTALSSLDGWQVACIGRGGQRVPGMIEADLLNYDPAWATHFAGCDAVLHLAADPKPVSGWESIAQLNIDLALNVYRAAENARVRRFVFASSNWVLGGYRFRRDRLTSSLAPRPINPYGASKLFMERYGLQAGARTGMSVLCLRIGYCHPGENRPGAHMAFGRWGQEMWLGNLDWQQAVIKSVTSTFSGSAVLNVVSRNVGMRWDLEEARDTIGFVPQERHRPSLSALSFIKEQGARLREWLSPTGSVTPLFGARW